MQDALFTKARTRSELIAEALGDTVNELRLVEAADLIGYIKAGQWANIADLVQSSAELSLKDHVLSFACSADYDVPWSGPPSLSLELEFQHSDVAAFFTLILGASDSTVVVKSIWFATMPSDESHGTQILAAALDDARRETGTSAKSRG